MTTLIVYGDQRGTKIKPFTGYAHEKKVSGTGCQCHVSYRKLPRQAHEAVHYWLPDSGQAQRLPRK